MSYTHAAAASAALSTGALSGDVAEPSASAAPVVPPIIAFAYSNGAFIHDRPAREGQEIADAVDSSPPADLFPRRCKFLAAVRVRPLSTREKENWQFERPLTTTIGEDAQSISIQEPEDESAARDRITAAAVRSAAHSVAASAIAAAAPPAAHSGTAAALPSLSMSPALRGAESTMPTATPEQQVTMGSAAAAPASAAAASSASVASPAVASTPLLSPALWSRTQPARSFTFDRAYGPDATNARLYDELIRPLIPGVMDGFGATVLVYGACGSGKSFTVKGTMSTPNRPPSTHPSFDGLLPMALREIFASIEQQPAASLPVADSSSSSSSSVAASLSSLDFSLCVVRMSCVDIYNESLIDCLLPLDSPSDRDRADLQITQTSPGVLYVRPLTWAVAPTLNSAMQLLELAHRRSQIRHTNMGGIASRSTKIFKIRIERRVNPAAVDGDATAAAAAASAASAASADESASSAHASSAPSAPTSTSRLSVGHLTFVDLCASNRQPRVSPHFGYGTQEAKRINLSLSALGNVVNALVHTVAHVPYRDSKLTRLIQPALGGNDRTVLIATLSPCAADFVESLSTLRFATRAAGVETRPRRRFDPDPDPAASLRQFDSDFAARRRVLCARGRCLLQRSLIWRLPLPRVLIDHIASFVTLGAGQRADEQIRDPRLLRHPSVDGVRDVESAAAGALAGLHCN